MQDDDVRLEDHLVATPAKPPVLRADADRPHGPLGAPTKNKRRKKQQQRCKNKSQIHYR